MTENGLNHSSLRQTNVVSLYWNGGNGAGRFVDRTYRDLDWMSCRVIHFRINSFRRYSWRSKIANSAPANDEFNGYSAKIIIQTTLDRQTFVVECDPQHKCASYVFFGVVFLFSCVLWCTQHDIRQFNFVLFLITLVLHARKSLVSQQLCTINCRKKKLKKITLLMRFTVREPHTVVYA